MQNIFALDERHLNIKLRELRLTVATLILITEAASDLEITLHAGDHEHLLQLLRGLWQRIELPGVYARGDEIISCAFGRGFEENGGLNFKEAVFVEIVSNELRRFMAQLDIAAHALTAQIKIAVFQTEVLIHFFIFVDQNGQHLGLIQNLDFFHIHFDLACAEIGVLCARDAFANFTPHLQDPLGASGFQGSEFGIHFGVANDLGDAKTITQVDKGHAAVIAKIMYPASQSNGLANMGWA